METRIVLLDPKDNCVVACTHLNNGTSLELDGQTVQLVTEIGLGHKLARHALRRGDKVIKYGAVIGHVTADIAIGEHLHTHNLASDYLPTYTHADGRAFVAHH